MTFDKATQLFRDLDTLLDDEKAALMDGALDNLPALLARKQALLEKVTQLGPDAGDNLAGLQQKTLRNQTLLDAALDGIRSVSERVAALRRVRASLDTYDREGQVLRVSAKSATHLERRA